jgi:hypothetical protein
MAAKLPAAKIASSGAPVKEFLYCREVRKICHSLLANVSNNEYRDGRISVRARHTTHIMHIDITSLAQSTSLSSNTLRSGVAVPASSLHNIIAG